MARAKYSHEELSKLLSEHLLLPSEYAEKMGMTKYKLYSLIRKGVIKTEYKSDSGNTFLIWYQSEDDHATYKKLRKDIQTELCSITDLAKSLGRTSTRLSQLTAIGVISPIMRKNGRTFFWLSECVPILANYLRRGDAE